jgi:hypothetical protein
MSSATSTSRITCTSVETRTDASFKPYLAEAEGDHKYAIALYVWNAQSLRWATYTRG